MYSNIDRFVQGFANGGGVGFERGRGSMYDSYPGANRRDEEEEEEKEERSFPDYGPPSVSSPSAYEISEALGGGDDNFSMASPEDELRYAREEISPFSAIYDLNRQLDADLASEGRRPVLGGLFSKEPGFGTSTNRFEGLSGIQNVLVSALDPLARAIDAPASAMRGLIPQRDMLSEGLGSAGFATLGGGFFSAPSGAIRSGASQSRRTPDDIQDYLDSLNKRAPINEFENQKAQMISGGASGENLEFALDNLARRLGIERPDK